MAWYEELPYGPLTRESFDRFLGDSSHGSVVAGKARGIKPEDYFKVAVAESVNAPVDFPEKPVGAHNDSIIADELDPGEQ